MLEGNELFMDSGGWLGITQTIANVFEDHHQKAESRYGVTDNPFVVRDQCRAYIRALMTLVMSILDSFELDVRVQEYQYLDAVEFDELLWNIQQAITNQDDAKLFALIEFYLQSKGAALLEIQDM